MKRLAILLISLCTAVLALFLVTRVSARAAWAQKIDPWVLQTAVDGASTEFLVVLAEQADIADVPELGNKLARGQAIYARKTAVAQRTQPAVIAALDAAGADYRPFWISNMIWVRGSGVLAEQLAQRPDVARIHANPAVQFDALPPDDLREVATSPEIVEWQIELVGATAVWEAGVRGAGVVVGGQDTGYDWTHPALQRQYRGWNADTAVADHSYSWHDAIHANNPNTPSGNPCGFDSPAPCDDNGHGTHTMGTMVGDDGGSFQIGMAPAAQWVACRNMEQGWGTPASYSECFEWFAAPYPQGGDPFTDGRPELAPHVIGNSWSCPDSEGCTTPEILRDVVEAVRTAGIMTVQAAANSGPACSSIDTPAAVYDASFTVAATDSEDTIAGFSARGPVTVLGDSGIKPDISAPGVGLLSARPGGRYGVSSGTSMATPMVVGAAALLMSAEPALVGDVDAVERVLQDTAVGLTTTDGCGGDTPMDVPNHTYGHGRIDIWAAFQAVTGVEPPVYRRYIPLFMLE